MKFSSTITGLFFITIINDIFSTKVIAVSVGDTVCVEGFIMDEFCIEREVLLDNPSFKTLENPEEHSVHCLVDVNQCTDSDFNILQGPDTSTGMYSIAYVVDDDGKEMLIEEARTVGAEGGWPRCSTCSGDKDTGLLKAFRAEVRGEVTDLGDGTDENPPKLKVTSVTASNELSDDEICTTMSNNPGPAPVPTPEIPDCFSGSNIVEVQGKGKVLMDTLKIGDKVVDGEGEYARIYSFGHLDRDAEAIFLQIHANGLEVPLEISPLHMIYVSGKPLRARDVKVGDMLGPNKVYEIGQIQRRGVYTPLTESGTIMVSGTKTSSFVARLDIPVFLQHFTAHAALSPLRLLCKWDFNICLNETYTDDNLSNSLIKLIKFVKNLSMKSKAVQLLAVISVSPLVTLLLLAENFMQHWFVFGFISMLLAVFKIRQTNKKMPHC